MADHGVRQDADSSSEALAGLRSIAQAHISEIADEDEQERASEILRRQEAGRYLRLPRKSRSKHTQNPLPHCTAKGSRLRSAQDVIDRLRWDAAYKSSDYLVGYLERFEGIKEMPLDSWTSEFTEEEWIPQHRIKYFKHIATSELVWHRDERIDKIFGSGHRFDADVKEDWPSGS